MRMNTQRILAALLSLVLLLALAPAGWADGEETGGGETGGETGGGVDASILTAPMPATGVNLNPGANTVNINLVPKDKEGTKFESDIVKANLVADLYLVAAAVKDENYDTYHYEFVGNAPVVIADANIFQDSLADDPDPEKQNKQETMLRTFSPLAQAFAKSIFTYEGIDAEKFPTKTAAATGTTIKVEGLDPGLYMLVLHGSDLKQKSENEDECYVTTMKKAGGGQYNEYGSTDADIVATRAYSDAYEFLFEPQMISLPTRVDDEGTQQYNTAYGTKWSNVLNIVAKPDWKPRNGELKITKTLNKYLDESKANDYSEPATFVFDVIGRKTADENSEIIYRRQIAMSFKNQETQTEVLDDIRIGTFIWVEEIYKGAHYGGSSNTTFPIEIKAKSTTDTNEGDSVSAETVAEAVFTNNDDETHRGGHGIENRFEFDKETGTWQWKANGKTYSQKEVEKQ